jgi:hypothetical protein
MQAATAAHYSYETSGLRVGGRAMEKIQIILGYMTLVAVAIAMILGLVILVLLEARWILSLWVALHRRWRATLRRLRDEAGHDESERNGASTSNPLPRPRGG